MSKKKIKKTKGATIDDLAVMVKNGFDSVDSRFNHVDKRLDDLDQGQEEIKLKLGDVAYRFELVELERRVNILERKVGKR